MNKFKKYQLVIVLTVIVVALGMIKYKFGYKGDGSEFIQQITIVPTAEPTPSISSGLTEKEDDYELWQQLPYSGEGFTIDRYIGPKTLAVKTKGLDKKIVEDKVIEWLTEQKVATESYKLVIE